MCRVWGKYVEKLFFRIAWCAMVCVAIFVVTPALAEASYYAEGTVLSTNMLSGASSVTAIASVTVTTTLPANTAVKIKYSQDNVNFYNAAGTQEGWDTCAAGTNTIDISALGWSTSIFYYKLQLSTTDSAATPVASDVQVNYTGSSVPDPPSTTHYQRQGTLLSTNVLLGAENVTAISSVTVTTTIPGGATVKIKYSQDNVNFYNAAGTQEGWDTCAAGTNTIDVSALGWTGGIFYYKLQWETIDDTTTPVVSDVQVNYTGDDPLPPDGNTYQQVGTVVSTDLMTGSTKAMLGTEYFAYWIRSLPGGSSIKAQFSQDGTNWYAADGTLWGESTLSFGVHMNYDTALSLAALNWADGTHFYYKLTLTTTDNTRSPVITSAGLIFAQSTTINSSENSEATNGLVGLWSFNGADVSGTTAYDRSGQGNNGTLTNGPTVTAGKIGQALRFDGSDDYVSLGSNRAGATKNAITVSYVTWVKPTAFQDYGNFYRESVNSSASWRFACGFRSTGKPVCGGRAPDGQSLAEWRSDTAVSLNEWHHFAATVDVSTDTVQIYIDGILQTNEANGTFTNAVFDNTNSHSISIGATSAGTERFTGDIDEVRVYNRVLSATEIWNLYQAGGGAEVNSADSQGDTLEQGLAGYWKLDDGSGTSATDASTNGNTGTLTNGPTWTTGQIGGAVSFDGTDDYITEAGSSLYKFTSSFAFGGWFQPLADNDSREIAGFDSGSSNRYALNIDNAGVESFGCRVRLTGGLLTATFTTTVVTGSWYNLYCSYDDSLKVVTLYVNGVKSATSSTGSGTLTDGGTGLQKFLVGRSTVSSPQYWLSTIDEVRIYNRSLYPEEVAKLYKMTAPDNPDAGLKGYWSFNGPDVSGTTAFDRSGVGNNGTLTNGPTVALGKIGQALSFDGNNDYVSAGDVNAVDGASTLTLSGWFKRSASNAILTVGKSVSGARTFNINFYNNGRIYVNVGDGGVNAYGYFTSNDTDWHHVVFVFDGNLSGNANRAKAYLDGVQQSLTFNNTIPAATQASSDNFEIGRDQVLATYSSGSIDEIRLYSRAFTQTEVTNLYNLGR